MILSSLGVIALYIAKMYDEQKARPLFLVRENRTVDQEEYKAPKE
jgi:hypothetical protein